MFQFRIKGWDVRGLDRNENRLGWKDKIGLVRQQVVVGQICFVKVGVKIGQDKIMKEPVCIYIVYSVQK